MVNLSTLHYNFITFIDSSQKINNKNDVYKLFVFHSGYIKYLLFASIYFNLEKVV